ncbi:MAG: zinc-binding alcohol dehydrogenase family protein [Verrucomicrobiaceae bacterium]|nr:zinc-binding alcohol dehydrogenase family protein [Verrucomicrobiaceae bacterium]
MRALQLTQKRQLHGVDIPEPGAPGPGEALVATKTMGVCGTDISGFLGKMPFIDFPRILGHELGVEVISVGTGVSHLQVGDRCCVEPYLHCGQCYSCRRGSTNCCEHMRVLGVHCDGGLRERMVLPASKLHVANSLSYEQLALVEMLGIGCHAVDRAKLSHADEVLVLGAGPIGLTVIEFTLLTGARTTVCEPGETRRAFVKARYPEVTVLSEPPNDLAAQVVFDATGNPGSMSQAFRYAHFTGRIIYVGITKEPVVLDDPLFHRKELTLLASRNALSRDFPRILELMTTGKLAITDWINDFATLDDAQEGFERWTKPGSTVVKAVIRVS